MHLLKNFDPRAKITPSASTYTDPKPLEDPVDVPAMRAKSFDYRFFSASKSPMKTPLFVEYTRPLPDSSPCSPLSLSSDESPVSTHTRRPEPLFRHTSPSHWGPPGYGAPDIKAVTNPRTAVKTKTKTTNKLVPIEHMIDGYQITDAGITFAADDRTSVSPTASRKGAHILFAAPRVTLGTKSTQG